MPATSKRHYAIRFTLNYPSLEERQHLYDVLQHRSVTRARVAAEVGDHPCNFHFQGFVRFRNARTFQGIKEFLGSDRVSLHVVDGTDHANWVYCSPDHAKKHDEFPLPGSSVVIYECGKAPYKGMETDGGWGLVHQHIEDGWSNFEIMRSLPWTTDKQSAMNAYRLAFLETTVGQQWRDVNVTLCFGAPGTGKTNYVRDTFGYENTHFVRQGERFSGNFDSYRGQDALCFDEWLDYRWQATSMNGFLDGHPIELPARYGNRMACFTNVVICTNQSLDDIYSGLRTSMPDLYYAFFRRVDTILEFTATGEVVQHPVPTPAE